MTAGREQDARETLRADIEAAIAQIGAQPYRSEPHYTHPVTGRCSTCGGTHGSGEGGAPPVGTGEPAEAGPSRQALRWAVAAALAAATRPGDQHAFSVSPGDWLHYADAVLALLPSPPATTGTGDEVWAQNEWENGGRWLARPIGAPSSPPATDGDAADGCEQ